MSDLDPALVEDPYPMQELFGYRMTGWSEGRATFELPLNETFTNRHGIPHGGVYAILLDTAMGYAGSYTGRSDDATFAMTLTMTTNFLSRPTGSTLIAEGRRTGGGKSTFFAEASVRDDDGTLIATGTGTFRLRSKS